MHAWIGKKLSGVWSNWILGVGKREMFDSPTVASFASRQQINKKT